MSRFAASHATRADARALPGSARSGPDDTLALQPPSGRARLWTFALTVGVPAIAVAASLALQPARWRPWAAGLLPATDSAIAVALPLSVVAIAWAAMAWALRRHRIEVQGDRIAVVAGFHRDRLALAELRLDQARIGSLGEHPEWKPLLKTNGMAVPGFRAGWFRSRRFQRVFACLAGGDRVLWIPTTRKHALVLEARQPQALLERLRALAGDGVTAAPRRR